MAQWYYTSNGQQAGPVDESQLKAMLASGQVGASEMVWKDGMANWQAASGVPELAGGAAPAPTPSYGQPQPQYGQPQQQYGQPQYGQPQYGQGQINYGPPAAADHFGKAMTSLILSIVGILLCGIILGPVSIVLSVLALNGMKASGNPRGKGLATAGLIIGIIDIPLAIIFGIIYVSSMQHSF